MKFKERKYQTQIKNDLYKSFNEGIKKVLIVAPTGSGKTLISTNIIQDAVSKGRKVLFLIHRDVLAEQTATTLKLNGIDSGFIMGSKRSDLSCQVQVASVQTLAVRDNIGFEPDLVFYDEAHLTAWTRYGKKILQRDCWHVGLTATPWRLKKSEGMGDLFDKLIHTPLPHELIDMGYLVKPRYFTLPKAELGNVRLSGGDYNQTELGVVCNTSEVINSLVDNWLDIAQGKRTIIFSVNVSHAQAIAKAFQEKGVIAKAISGKMHVNQRNVIYEELKSNQTQIIVSCEALAEGFDVPTIECVCLARPTKSKAKYFQQVGRGLRIAEGKTECLVLDQAGMVESFGLIEDFIAVELENGQEKGSGGSHLCEHCNKVKIPMNMTICRFCAVGASKNKQYPIGKMVEIVIASGKKRQYDYFQLRLERAFINNYSPGWAIHQFKNHYKCFPDINWSYHAIFGDNPTWENKKAYFEYLNEQANKKKLKGQDALKFIRKYYFYLFRESLTKVDILGFVKVAG